MAKFETYLQNLQPAICSICCRYDIKAHSKKYPDNWICTECKKYQPGGSQQDKPNPYCKQNETVPCKLPECLTRLTELEGWLIARAIPKISAWNVTEVAGKLRGLQRKYKGHILSDEVT